MTNEHPSKVVELVVYKIKPEMKEAYVQQAMEKFHKIVMSFDGFIRYDFHQSCHNGNTFMDLVHWESLEAAKAAAAKVKEIQKGPEFRDYIESFESLEIFEHFRLRNRWE